MGMRITNTGVSSDLEEIERLREDFEKVNCVRIPHLLDPPLLACLRQRLEQSTWVPKVHQGIALETITEDRHALHLCHFVTNLAAFRRLIGQITGCGPLKMFHGRLYRMVSSLGHYDSWHDDDFENRLVGMSINLSPFGYGGGLFELRRKASEQMLAQIANTGFGDALVFKISGELQHRVSPVNGHEPKTAFAGWFQPDLGNFFEDVIKLAKRDGKSRNTELKV